MGFITVYDGARTIGGNKIYVEEKDSGVFLDFGMNFAKYQEFFQEFLFERAVRGIHDLINLNLIPKLNIYREDLITKDIPITDYPELKVKAVLLSHAHLDHCGNIGLLKPTIPIVASPTTIGILKVLRDITTVPHIGSEVAYYSPRGAIDEAGLVLKTGGEDYVGRSFYCNAEHLDPLKTFISELPGTPSKRRKQLNAGELCKLNEMKLPFEIKDYEVDHSIFGATAYILRGDLTIAYTGDFRLHGRNAAKSKLFVDKAKDASILIIEGTRVERSDINESEETVFQNCLKVVQESKKLI
ncbi:MAG: MBL fold metallo-hydrolase, partial [Candidatus Helarchaeota archaeon]|nr:MBL fold metallo-hydrolase [Candidatus Helarchaeota archaeon]